MRLFTPTVLIASLLSILAFSRAAGIDKREVVMWSAHGTITSPVQGATIVPGADFPFSYQSTNPCHSDGITIAVYLGVKPADSSDVTSDGRLPDGTYIHDFGKFTVINWGLQRAASNAPPPSPAKLSAPASLPGIGTHELLYLIVVENFGNCPPTGSNPWLSLAAKMVFYG